MFLKAGLYETAPLFVKVSLYSISTCMRTYKRVIFRKKEKCYLAVSPGSRVRFLMTFLIVGVPQVRTEKENVTFI